MPILRLNDSSAEVAQPVTELFGDAVETPGSDRPVRALSLDGGGIRGISSILILKEIMRHVNKGRADELQPGQVFDLIGGTSTGGIIAIMLGCLHMTLDDCLCAYTELSKSIFKPKRSKYNLLSRFLDLVSAKERYDSAKMEKLAKAIIEHRTGSAHTRLQSQDSACKVFVATVNADDNELALLRSYHNPQELDSVSAQFELWEAIRATSAATTYFNELQHETAAYVDGAFKCNNPVFQVAHELKDLWPDRPPFILSIGTGAKSSIPLRGHLIKLASSLAKLVTETEETWNRFNRCYKDLTTSEMLFRCSVPEIGRVGLGDYRKIDAIASDTDRWLHSAPTERYITSCARKLLEIESTDWKTLQGSVTTAENPRLSVSDDEKEYMCALHRAAPEYESHRVSIEKPVPGTCEWIHVHPRFQAWHASTSSMLWVTSNPGCGKSVLASSLVDYYRQYSGDQAIVLSFFFRAGEASRSQSHQALCAVLHGLLSFDRTLVRKLAKAEVWSKDLVSATTHVEGLWDSLCTAVSQLGRQVICIIDALDECDMESRTRLCKLLAAEFGPGASTAPSNLKILATSRPCPEIETLLQMLPSVRLRGEDEERYLLREIDTVIQHRVRELTGNNVITEETALKLRRRLARGAENTFLWASLVLDQVTTMSSRRLGAIEDVLGRMPSTLEQLYQHALTTFADPSSSFAMLETLLAAKRTLSVDEVNVALSVGTHTSCHTLERDLEPDVVWTIKRLGGYFVRISHSRVHLVHKTARDFLLSARSKATEQAEGIDMARANARLATSCVRFLLLEGLPYRQSDMPKYDNWDVSNALIMAAMPDWCSSFFQYAATNWYLHFIDDALFADSSMRLWVKRLCDTGTKHFSTWWPFLPRTCYWPREERIDTHYAHFAARRKHTAIVRGLIESGYCSVEDEDEFGIDLLTLAATTGNVQLVKWMLGRKIPDTAILGSAFLASLSVGVFGVSAVLAATGIDMNAVYKVRTGDHRLGESTPMCTLLGREGSVEPTFMQLLCDHGLVVQDTYLVAVASRGLRGCLEVLLLRDGRRMDDRVPGLTEAYQAATVGGWPKSRALILETARGRLEDKADVSLGLPAASERVDPEAVQQLLELGASDSSGQALVNVCSYTQAETLEQLLRTQCYSPAQLDAGLTGYFEASSGDDLRAYQEVKFSAAFGPSTARRPFCAFHVSSLFGWSDSDIARTLEILIERGAKAQTKSFVRMVATVIPMNEEFAIYLLERAHLLQPDPSLGAGHFLALGCLWGKAALVRRALETGWELAPPQGAAVLLAATVSGNPEVIQALLERKVPLGVCLKALDGDDMRCIGGLEVASTQWSKVIQWAASQLTDAHDWVQCLDVARALGYKDIVDLLGQHD